MGGSNKGQLPKEDYAHVKSAEKSIAMAQHLISRLFSKETRMKSTVHGTKEFTQLDAIIIAATKRTLET